MAPARRVALVGTTASGMSELALAVARGRPGVELVSVDSMCVYREMDLATAKPSPEARAEVAHHLVDLVDPGEEFTVAQFQDAASVALAGIEARGNRALLVGGTGLYLRAVTDSFTMPGRYPEVAAALKSESESPEGLAGLFARLGEADPLAASRIEPGNRRRIVRALEVTVGSGRPFSSFGPGLEHYPPVPVRLLGIPFVAADVDRRIDQRFDTWMAEGLVDEVRGLAQRPGGLSRTARQALGYRELLAHVEDGVDLDEAVEAAKRRTRAFARRQWAWFRRDPRITWMGPQDDRAGIVAGALEMLDGRP